MAKISVPWPLFHVPGGLILGVFGVRGWAELRKAERETPTAPEPPVPFTAIARALTVAMGVVLAGAAVSAGFAEEFPEFAPIYMAVGGVLVLVWSLSSSTGSLIPPLGLLWRAPQWSAFVLAALLLLVLTLLSGFTDVVTPLVGVVAGAALVLLFVLAAAAGRPHSG